MPDKIIYEIYFEELSFEEAYLRSFPAQTLSKKI